LHEVRRALRLALFLVTIGASGAALADGPSATGGACALDGKFGFLKDLAFANANTLAPTRTAPLAELKRASIVKMSGLATDRYDPASGRLECSGTMELVLPLAAAAAFGGTTTLSALVRYTAEPSSERQGFTIVGYGVSPVSRRLAEAAQRLPDVPTLLATPANTPSEPMATTAPVVDPAFACALAQGRAEALICSDPIVAQRDRTLNLRYFAARRTLGATDRQKLLLSQRSFLAERNRCDTAACMIGVYDRRVAQLEVLTGRR
jgi:uncharacterized protein YecT (DUF1311 family)